MQPCISRIQAVTGAAGISRNTPVFHSNIKFEYEETTLQVPFGDFSILEELKAGKVKPIEAIVTLTLGYRSNWTSGLTWRTSTRQLHKAIGVSHRYIRDTLNRAVDWITRQTAPVGNTAGTWKVTHHNCSREEVPTDRDGLPQTFAIPRGEGGPFERMFAGDISWKGCLVWLLLKLHTDWEAKNGITAPLNMDTLCKWTGFSKSTVIAIIQELQAAGMIERLSQRWERSVFQLYPKPSTSIHDTVIVVIFFLKTLDIGVGVADLYIRLLFITLGYWTPMLSRNTRLTTSHAILLRRMRMRVRTIRRVTIKHLRYRNQKQTRKHKD